MLYYILLNNRQMGPFTPEQVMSFPVTVNTPAKTAPDAAWQPLSEWPELRDALTARCAAPDKTVAGILALILGGLGVQYFYLGKMRAGFLSIILFMVTCTLWQTVMFIQGIMMLAMSQQEFDQKYVRTSNKFPLF